MTVLNQNTTQTTWISGASATGMGGTLLAIEQNATLISLGLVAVGALVGIGGLVLNYHFRNIEKQRRDRQEQRENDIRDRITTSRDERTNYGPDKD